MKHDISFKDIQEKIFSKNKDEGLNITRHQVLKTSIIKAVWYWLKDRQIDQWKRTESPEIDLHTLKLSHFSRA